MAGPGSVSVYSQATYTAPSFGRMQLSMQPQLSSAAPYLLSSRLYTSMLSTEEAITATQAQQAEASPSQEEEEEQVEEDEKEEEAEEDEEEEGVEKEEEKQEGEGGDEEQNAEGKYLYFVSLLYQFVL